MADDEDAGLLSNMLLFEIISITFIYYCYGIFFRPTLPTSALV